MSGEGNDTVYNSISGATIDGGDGADFIFNDSIAYNAVIESGDGDDTIRSDAEDVTINAGDGNDLIRGNYRLNTKMFIDGGDGNDSIEYYGENSTIFAGFGDDLISGYFGLNSLIYAEGGNNYISARTSTILSGNGNDTIYGGSTSFADISGGDNYISVEGDSTVCSGDGDDTVRGSSTAFFNVGDGDNHVSVAANSTILCGDGDNEISIGSYSTVEGGDGNNAIYAGTNSVIQIGNGDNEITIGNYSTVECGDGNDIIQAGQYSQIHGGGGDDYIFSNTGSTIFGGKGNDVIVGDAGHFYYSEGDGDDLIIDYSNRYTTVHLLDSPINGAYSDGNDVIIQIGSGSLRFSESADKTIDIIDPQGNTIHFSNVPALTDDLSSVSGSSTVASSNLPIQDNRLIIGTEQDDTLTNGGNHVSISALDGDDLIRNYYYDYSSTYGSGLTYGVYLGDDVTINAGRGNDTIEGNSTKKEIFQYASRDGDDVIYGYNAAYTTFLINDDGSIGTLAHDGDIINITEGSMVRASLDGSDVVMIIGGGSIRLKDAKNKEITVVEDDGATVTFTNNFIKAPYVRHVGADVNMMATHEEGESVIAANGAAFIDTYHLLSTDNQDNISRLVMTNHEYKLTTPNSSSAVSVEGANTQIMAAVIGAADFTWTGDRLNIVAVDEPISVDVTMDGVSVFGSDGNDSLKSSARNVTLRGGAGNDTLHGSDQADTFICSALDGNDLIVNFDSTDIIRSLNGRLNTAALDGSDVVLTVGDSNITLRGAKDIPIKFINSDGSTKIFTNSYEGVSDEMLSTAKSFLDALESGLTTKLREGADAISTGSSESAFNDLKRQLNWNNSIPDEVCRSIADAVANKIDSIVDVNEGGYTYDLFGAKLVNRIGEQLRIGLDTIPDRSVTVKGVKYNISFPASFALFGTSANFVDVTHNGVTTHLTFSTKDVNAFAAYCADMKKLAHTACTKVIRACATDIVSDISKIMSSNGFSLESLYQKLRSNPVYKDIRKSEVKSIVKDVVSHFENGDKLIKAAETLEGMRNDYYAIDDKADYDAFIKSGNKIAKTLGVEKIPTGGGIWDWFKGLFNELPATQTDYWFTQSDMTSDVSDLDSIIDNNLMGNKNTVADQLIQTTAENIFPAHEIVGVKDSRHKRFYGLK